MTIITNPVQPAVLGQQLQPGFGVQSGGAVPASMNPIIPLPLAGTNIGPVVTAIEAQSRAALPANALVNSVNGVSVGGAVNVIGSDPATVAQVFSNGNGVETCRGASVALNGANSQQIFSDGFGAGAQNATGPAAKNTSSLVEAPVAASTLLANVSLIANQYGG